MKYKSIKGTKDILPGEVESWQHIEEVVRKIMNRYNYHEIRTPVFENTSLFARSIGELTDIVRKEMYTFSDRSNDSLTLKPEGTASVLRSYIQHNLGEQSPLTKLFYISPMFRQERPQAGRLRQFHQYGAEALGSSSPLIDAEIILLAYSIYQEFGIRNTTLKLNSVGCSTCRPPYKDLLTEFLEKIEKDLSEESRSRTKQNPMRVLDSKDENDQKAVAQAPLIKDHLCSECETHFNEVLHYLKSSDISYSIDGKLVRGLDYYTKTAFEIISGALGSQDALAGGGRYDLLVEELGGKPTPGVGFAAGIERLLIVLNKQGMQLELNHPPKIYLVCADKGAQSWIFSLATSLRADGISVEIDYLDRSLKAQMREANKLNAEFVIVIGEQELRDRKLKLKNMKSGDETTISANELSNVLR